jgi:hypothetical protein
MPYFKPPNIKNPDIALKVASVRQTTCSRFAKASTASQVDSTSS